MARCVRLRHSSPVATLPVATLPHGVGVTVTRPEAGAAAPAAPAAAAPTSAAEASAASGVVVPVPVLVLEAEPGMARRRDATPVWRNSSWWGRLACALEVRGGRVKARE